jgi:hypothetical protein
MLGLMSELIEQDGAIFRPWWPKGDILINQDEILAKQYLDSLGYKSVVHEPDGNVTPDFLNNGNIAVEVRRLNQNHFIKPEEKQGLEEVFIPIWQGMENLLGKIGPIPPQESWFVRFKISRPQQPQQSWKTLAPEVRRSLEEFLREPERLPRKIQVTPTLQIVLKRAGKFLPSTFQLGSAIDLDADGYTLSELHRNLTIVVAEKEEKIAPHRQKYQIWWLVLLDYISHGLSDEEKEEFRTFPLLNHRWDKIILINPIEPNNACEVS